MFVSEFVDITQRADFMPTQVEWSATQPSPLDGSTP